MVSIFYCPLDGSWAYPEFLCQLGYRLALRGESPGDFPVSAPLQPVLLPSWLVIDAAGKGAVEAGEGDLTSFVMVMAELRWQIQLKQLHIGYLSGSPKIKCLAE